ncbi:MAG: DUF1015 domain-containing protein, partial [Rhodospirillales bacterium]|nr:DUF1015 domain-containing protein [Rhodospirillales bacterium]
KEYLSRLGNTFSVIPHDDAAKPNAARHFGMYMANQWYDLTPKEPVSAENPVATLDISVLTDLLLAPILDIGDPRLDKRIEFIGGIRGMKELQRRVDSGEMAVAFAIYPTSLADLMAVADANQVMPPKSTWFEPKLADGLITVVLD